VGLLLLGTGGAGPQSPLGGTEDHFSGPNSNLAGRTPDTKTFNGSTWVDNTGSNLFLITGGFLKCNTPGGNGAIDSGLSSGTMTVDLEFDSTDGEAGFFIRGAAYYVLVAKAAGLLRILDSSLAALATTSGVTVPTFTPPTTLTLTFNGSSLSANYNGSVVNYNSATASPGNTQVGVRVNSEPGGSGSIKFFNFKVTP
jgi:hypothetical protein